MGGLSSLVGQQQGEGLMTSGAAGAATGFLSSLLGVPKWALAALAAEAYRNPQIQQMFHYGKFGTNAPQPAQPSAAAPASNDPYSVENLQKLEDQKRQEAADVQKQWEKERDDREKEDERTQRRIGEQPPPVQPAEGQ